MIFGIVEFKYEMKDGEAASHVYRNVVLTFARVRIRVLLRPVTCKDCTALAVILEIYIALVNHLRVV